jgi:hypothetical protein
VAGCHGGSAGNRWVPGLVGAAVLFGLIVASISIGGALTPLQMVLTIAYLGGIGFLLVGGCRLIFRFARPEEPPRWPNGRR